MLVIQSSAGFFGHLIAGKVWQKSFPGYVQTSELPALSKRLGLKVNRHSQT